MSVKDNPVLWKLMIIGDLIAMFVIVSSVLFIIYNLIRKYRPQICYYNDKFDLSQIKNYLCSKIGKIQKRNSWKRRTITKSVSFKGGTNEEAIYEEPYNIDLAPTQVVSHSSKCVDYLRYESYVT